MKFSLVWSVNILSEEINNIIFKKFLIDTLKTGTQKGILKKPIPDAKQDKNPLTVNQ